ncbi:hypothetical protein ACUXHY_002636 [Cytobacillus horneckiae]|uniref:hypothetical protein n=1 Tax=Cytobacillus horneckiae TaxID=549687 RepID=UPI000826F561|nr:hypothetical protein [Cytobacillus horneckiae]MBN6888964.1 hypothetical protein [Cytobacillus horneckiae]
MESRASLRNDSFSVYKNQPKVRHGKALKKEIGWHGAKYGNFKAKPISIHHTEHLGKGLGAEIKRM